MGAVVDRGELGGGELSVALGGGETLVAEELLNGAEVGAFFKQVGSEGVAQGVWVDVRGQSAQDGDALDDAADAARGEASLTAVLDAAQLQIEKEGGRSAFAGVSARRRRLGGGVGGCEMCGALSDVGAEGNGGGVAQGDVALLLAFAADEDGFVRPVNVVEVEAR